MCDHCDSGLQSGVAQVHLRSHQRPGEAGRASGCSPPEEERGKGTFSRQSCSPQNKLALFLQLKCCEDVPWGKRINSTWPSDLITTHSSAALLRPPARRWGARLGSSVERQAGEKTCGCIIYKKRRQHFSLQTLSSQLSEQLKVPMLPNQHHTNSDEHNVTTRKSHYWMMFEVQQSTQSFFLRTFSNNAIERQRPIKNIIKYRNME